MKLREAILTRRTTRKFKATEIPDETLHEILEAGTWAPSHGNNQPWEFLIIGPETRTKLLEAFLMTMEAGPLADPDLPEERKEAIRSFAVNFGDAPVVMAVVSPPALTDLERYDFPMSAAAAIQNIFLDAWDKGIAGVWLSFGNTPRAREVLGTPEDRRVAGVLALGYPEVIPPAQPRAEVKERLRRLP